MESAKAFKRKMLLWTSNWSQEDPSTADEVRFTPDAVDIASLLLATGFRVRFMDRCLPMQMHPVPDVPSDSPACRVTLMCPKSGLRMELDAATTSCKCPSADSGLSPSWTVEEPASAQMDDAINSAIPQLSHEISKSVAELIGGLFNVMNRFPDENHNDAKVDDVQSTLPSDLTSHQKSDPAKPESVERSPTKTPATGIAVVTPNAPDIPKMLPGEARNGVPGRYRSLDTLISSGGFPDDLPEPGQLTPKAEEPEGEMEVDGDLESTLMGSTGSSKKMFISKSSPAVHYTEQFQRADTFVFGDAEGDDVPNENGKRMLIRSNTYVADDHAEEPRPGPPPQRIPSPMMVQSFSQSAVLSKLQNVQQVISELIFMIASNERGLSNIGEVSKASKAVASAVQQITDNVRPIRCLSDFGSVPNLSRAATTIRSIPRSNIRRYATTIAAPATPTTSRRGNTAPLVERTKRSSTTALSLAGATGKPAVSPSRPGANKLTVSVPGQRKSMSPSSTGATTSSSKLSSSKKFAHVQSSIPKPRK